METKLEVYTFKVRVKGQTKDYEVLSNVLGNDFMKFVTDFIAIHDKSFMVNKELQRSFQIMEKTSDITKDKRGLFGIIESGDYGDETKIVNQRGALKFTKQKDDLIVRPFYYLIYIPKTGRIGYLILQRTGVHGINNLFQKSLLSYFDHIYSDHKIDVAQYLSKELVQQFIKKGGIKELIFTKYISPKDPADKLDLGKITEETKEVQIKIIAKSKRFLSFNDEISKFLTDKNSKFFDSKGLEDIGVDKSCDVSVKIKNDGKNRVIDLSDSGQVRPYYNIDKEVKKDSKTGHVNLDSINQIAIDLIKEILDA